MYIFCSVKFCESLLHFLYCICSILYVCFVVSSIDGQHDDRSRGPTRRGGYRGRGRPRYSRGGRGGQGREINPRSRLEDDHDMGEEGMSGGHRQRL